MKKLFKIIFSIFAFIGVAIIGIAVFRTSSAVISAPPSDIRPADSEYLVTYEVAGSTGNKSQAAEVTVANITYSNEQGGTQQEEIQTPWSKTFTIKRREFLYLSAQNRADNGRISAKILINGQAFKQSESIGGYVIASASGRCC